MGNTLSRIDDDNADDNRLLLLTLLDRNLEDCINDVEDPSKTDCLQDDKEDEG